MQKLAKKGGELTEAVIDISTSAKGIGVAVTVLAILAGLFLRYVSFSSGHPNSKPWQYALSDRKTDLPTSCQPRKVYCTCKAIQNTLQTTLHCYCLAI